MTKCVILGVTGDGGTKPANIKDNMLVPNGDESQPSVKMIHGKLALECSAHEPGRNVF